MRATPTNVRYREAYGDGDGVRNPGGSSRLGGDYQLLDLSSPQSLQNLTGAGWGNTGASLPFARAGLNFGTVKDLRVNDRNFTGHDILKAAGDVKSLGFGVNDKRAMCNHATIRHYDNAPDATNDAEKKFKYGFEHDKDVQELLRQRGLCQDPVKQKLLDAQIEQHKQHYIRESGLQKRIDDPKNHPKARAAIKDEVGYIVHRDRDYRHEHDSKASREITPEARAAKKAQSGAVPVADRENKKIAKADAGKDGAKAKGDLVAGFGVDDGPPKPSVAQTPSKPTPT